ncbi:putative hemolysin [Balneicella halophila]|uniref:Putative hemolysin n=1 Tax=Balneicella halophila TaxID=1537566 RepID=A0A7L4UPI9_BALHA|nr:GNAT family N-acyltransferase [Balneicella halophila]PVX49973.1 putative hemolysin [Balneicella halophila]
MSLVDPKDLLAASDSLNKFGGMGGAKLLMYFLRLTKLNKIYDTLDDSDGLKFIDSILDSLQINFTIDEDYLQRIPKEGPFIVVANHPFGGVDGIILLKVLAEARPDTKVMANFLLKKIEPIADYIIEVNPFENRPDIKSTKGLKEAIKHLNDGGPLAIFPAGEVSSFQKGFRISDRKWSNSILRFIKKAKVPVVPIYFHGNNSLTFYMLGKVHPVLRTIKLPSELLNKQNKEIKLSIGKPISVKEQDYFSDIEHYGRYLRANTFTLSNTLKLRDFYEDETKSLEKSELIDAIDPKILRAELDAIPEEFKLYEIKNYRIYCTNSNIIPNILREIGRLRELTFREVGEGTNQPMDLDEYDLYYHQLFIYDIEVDKIVGAYRIGKGKEVIQQYGIEGFYLHSLFKLKKPFHPILEESLELGRSFITPDYQRKALPLFLLWKGILYMMLKNPEYRYLIGPVSISNDYSDLAKEMIIKFIMKHHFNYELSRYVKPRHKFKFKTKNIDTEIMLEIAQEDINKLDKYIGKFETKDVRLPVLLKKYIFLNAKILGFNRDPLFNNCLDGFILLDIYEIPDKVINSLTEDLNEDTLKSKLEK